MEMIPLPRLGFLSGVVIISGTERRNGTTASRSGFYQKMIIYGTERVAFRLLQESDNFRNGTTASRSGFYQNMIIYGTEQNGGTYNFRNGTELCSGFYKNMIISGTERLHLVPDFTRI